MRNDMTRLDPGDPCPFQTSMQGTIQEYFKHRLA